MKKINSKARSAAISLLLCMQMACNPQSEDQQTKCEISKELKGSKFSVYYLDKNNPFLKPRISIRLCGKTK